jgi:hypothetical protein
MDQRIEFFRQAMATALSETMDCTCACAIRKEPNGHLLIKMEIDAETTEIKDEEIPKKGEGMPPSQGIRQLVCWKFDESLKTAYIKLDDANFTKHCADLMIGEMFGQGLDYQQQLRQAQEEVADAVEMLNPYLKDKIGG